jgi:uncharacterized repeat protein (TIGR03803 family)
VAITVQHQKRNSAAPLRVNKSWLLAVLFLAAFAIASAQAQTFKTLHSFNGTSGAYPVAGLVIGPDGNLYGTTQQGGAHGLGTVFEVESDGKFVLLHSFAGADGAFPSAGLAFDSHGNVYGTTMLGGNSNRGTVFKVGTKSVSYSFSGKHGDGAYPIAGVVVDSAGNAYGTTQEGGSHGYGTVFKFDGTSKETVLYSFRGVPDGEYPCAGLILDKKGNLYGTTQLGGGTQNDGTVFKLTPAGKEAVLHSFTFANGDGAYPIGGVVSDGAGNLYGTTSDGGANRVGIVFKLDKSGKESVLYSMGTNSGDGLYPFAGLIRDTKGNLYGTAELGGPNGGGTIFEVTPAGEETTLQGLGGSDGSIPLAGLARDSKGNLYGTTAEGGTSNNGVVFKLTP